VVCYQMPGGKCATPEELAVPGEPVPPALLPDITVTRRDTGVPQPGGRSNGRGEFQILELPVSKPLVLMACGMVASGGARTRYCGFADATAHENKDENASPIPAHMTRSDQPTSGGGGQLVEFNLAAVGGAGPGGPCAEGECEPAEVPVPDSVDLALSIATSGSGSAIDRATVILIDLESRGVTYVRRSDAHGLYTKQIQSGATYAVTILAEGFGPANFFLYGGQGGVRMRREGEDWHDVTKIELAPLSPALNDFRGEGGIATAEAMMRFRFDNAGIELLPLRVRSADQLALLLPGVSPPPETWAESGPGIAPGVGTAGQFSVNGIRSRENNFTMDGSDNNDEDVGVRRQGFIALFPQSLDSLAEFQVITALPDARFGRTIGGQVNAVSQSSGNRFHGKVYGFLSDARWNARDFFDLVGSQYPSAARSQIPITTDGTFNGPRVQFASVNPPFTLDPASIGLPFQIRDGVGYQSNPAAPDTYTHTQYGTVLGGPVTRDNTFLYIGVEGIGLRSTRETHFAVPTVRERGLFESGDRGLMLPEVISAPNGTAAAGAPVPTVPANIQGTAVFSLFPFPNDPLGPYGVNTYTERLASGGDGNVAFARIDRQQPLFGFRHLITARFNRTDENSILPAVEGAIFSSLRAYWRTYNGVLIVSTGLTANLANNFRFAYGRTGAHFDEVRSSALIPSHLPQTPMLLNAPLLFNFTREGMPATYTAEPLLSSSGPYPTTPYWTTEDVTGPLGQVEIAGFSPVGVDPSHFPQRRSQDTFQWADTLTFAKGRHLLYAGADLRRSDFDNWIEKNTRPQLTFNGLPVSLPADCGVGAGCQSGFTALDLAALGVPASFLQTVGTTNDYSLRLRKLQADGFVQDNIRLARNFRLMAGLRLEGNGLPTDLDQKISQSFDAAFITAAINAGFQVCDNSTNGVCRPIVQGLITTLTKDFGKTFGGDRLSVNPRIGFAWDPFQTGQTTVRGGFGVYTGQFPAIVMNESRSSFPSFLTVNQANYVPFEPIYSLALLNAQPGTFGTFPHASTEAATAGTFIADVFLSLLEPASISIIQPAEGIKNPLAYHAAFSLDRTLRRDYLAASISYVGTFGRRLLRVETPFGGPAVSSITPPLLTSAVFPVIKAVPSTRGIPVALESATINPEFFASTSNSSYHSLQAVLRGGVPRGLQFNVAFTYAHSIDDASDFFDTAGTPALPQDSFHRSERASSSFDVRLRAVAHAAWDLSRGSNSRWLGGWFVSGIYMAQSGQPYTVNTTYDWNADGNLTDRLDNTVGLIQTPAGGDPRVRLSLAPGTNPMDLLAPHFPGQDPATYRSGAVGRNTFNGIGLTNLDLALIKAFRFGEAARLELRTELFNAFNRADFGLPVRYLEAPGFGQSVNTIQMARSLQFGCGLSF